MPLTQKFQPQPLFPRYQLQTPLRCRRPSSLELSPQQHTSPLYPASEIDLDLELDPDAHSVSSSPLSTQSLLSQFSLANIPTLAIPPASQPHVGLYGLSNTSTAAYATSFDEPSLLAPGDAMQAESWLPIQTGASQPGLTSRSYHYRDGSLSSLASTTGPASPHPHHGAANPRIAVTDSAGESFHGLPTTEDYEFSALSKPFAPIPQDVFFANYPAFAVGSAVPSNLSGLPIGQPRSRNGLVPPSPETAAHHSRSRPLSIASVASVASSINSDSPATPAPAQVDHEDERRRTKAAFSVVPKLDRTMTDICNDLGYNPEFQIASTSPIQTAVSPRSDMFAQRIDAANSQHMTSKASASNQACDKAFRQGSPFVPSGLPSNIPAAFGAGTRLAASNSSGTPQTISPKDTLMEYNPAAGEADFLLFPPTDTKPATLGNSQLEAVPTLDPASFERYVAQSFPSGIPIPQQYPFVSQPRQQQMPVSNVILDADISMESSRRSSGDAYELGGVHGTRNSPGKPPGASADGGTYTCTYHGCTLRFETPALLQKHKREGHRQAHGMGTQRRVEVNADHGVSSNISGGMTSSLLNSQAGPHRCDRINPSTGKSCATVFSRPYDLTRHEDTIHNARKQKVRCNLCTDDKSFSRADALTRHYRVCHPEFEFSGKHRRRGGLRV